MHSFKNPLSTAGRPHTAQNSLQPSMCNGAGPTLAELSKRLSGVRGGQRRVIDPWQNMAGEQVGFGCVRVA